MSKASIYAANTTAQTLAGGGAVNLGAPIHGFGRTCCQKTIDINGNNLVFREGGLYALNISATVTDSAAATVTLTVYQDGVATDSVTAANIAAANDAASVSLTAGIRVPQCGSSIVTVVATTDAGNPIIGSINTLAFKL